MDNKSEKNIKSQELSLKLEENNKKIKELDERIEIINKMIKNVSNQNFSSINQTLESINEMLEATIRERNELEKENETLQGAIKYLDYSPETVDEKLLDRLWKNALKENEMRDKASQASTEEEREKAARSARSYAMNNARWNANSIKRDYNESLDQYKNYIRNEMAKILGISSHEGIENENPNELKYQLDDSEIERFNELKIEFNKISNKPINYEAVAQNTELDSIIPSPIEEQQTTDEEQQTISQDDVAEDETTEDVKEEQQEEKSEDLSDERTTEDAQEEKDNDDESLKEESSVTIKNETFPYLKAAINKAYENMEAISSRPQSKAPDIASRQATTTTNSNDTAQAQNNSQNTSMPFDRNLVNEPRNTRGQSKKEESTSIVAIQPSKKPSSEDVFDPESILDIYNPTIDGSEETSHRRNNGRNKRKTKRHKIINIRPSKKMKKRILIGFGILVAALVAFGAKWVSKIKNHTPVATTISEQTSDANVGEDIITIYDNEGPENEVGYAAQSESEISYAPSQEYTTEYITAEPTTEAQEFMSEYQTLEPTTEAQEDMTEYHFVEPTTEEYSSEQETENKEKINNEVSLGETVTIKDGAPIYTTEYNAYLERNQQHRYFEYSKERVIVGKAYWNKTTGMEVIYAYDPDAKIKEQNVLANGGELVAVVTEMKQEYLPHYDGKSTLAIEDYKPEGWAAINDIERQVEKEYMKGAHR